MESVYLKQESLYKKTGHHVQKNIKLYMQCEEVRMKRIS